MSNQITRKPFGWAPVALAPFDKLRAKRDRQDKDWLIGESATQMADFRCASMGTGIPAAMLCRQDAGTRRAMLDGPRGWLFVLQEWD